MILLQAEVKVHNRKQRLLAKSTIPLAEAVVALKGLENIMHRIKSQGTSQGSHRCLPTSA